MAGWNQPGVLDQAASAVLAAMLASWATFLPSFVFIFLGAPYVERVTRAPRLSAALAAITAAVVGIIATLALLLARVVLLPEGWSGGVGWAALAIAATVWWTLEHTKVELHWVLLAAALAGLAAQALGGA
jgi:chromate transporter